MVTVFRDGSHRSGTRLIRIHHFLPPYSPAPFFQTLVIDSKNQELEASALFENGFNVLDKVIASFIISS